jgi:Putative Zn-dependent protease, contains TPR repeats
MAQSADFFITPQPALPRPWVLSVPTAAGDEAWFLNELGRQYIQARRFDKARPLLEEAFHRDPASTRFGIDLCNALLQGREYARVKSIAGPMVKEQSRFEFSLVLGQACQGLGEFEEAIAQYAEHITRFGANVQVFNQIGECYLQLGNPAEALKAWEKSLSLNPKQPQLQEKIAALKKNKP